MGKPDVRNLRGGAGNVVYGGTVNPPRYRKGGAGNPPPTGARASALPDGAAPASADGRAYASNCVPFAAFFLLSYSAMAVRAWRTHCLHIRTSAFGMFASSYFSKYSELGLHSDSLPVPIHRWLTPPLPATGRMNSLRSGSVCLVPGAPGALAGSVPRSKSCISC